MPEARADSTVQETRAGRIRQSTVLYPLRCQSPEKKAASILP